MSLMMMMMNKHDNKVCVCVPITTTNLPGYSFVRDRLDQKIPVSISFSLLFLNAINGKLVF